MLTKQLQALRSFSRLSHPVALYSATPRLIEPRDRLVFGGNNKKPLRRRDPRGHLTRPRRSAKPRGVAVAGAARAVNTRMNTSSRSLRRVLHCSPVDFFIFGARTRGHGPLDTRLAAGISRVSAAEEFLHPRKDRRIPGCSSPIKSALPSFIFSFSYSFKFDCYYRRNARVGTLIAPSRPRRSQRSPLCKD